METFEFGDKVTSAKWLNNEPNIVLASDHRGRVTVVNEGGKVIQLVHVSFLTKIANPIPLCVMKPSKRDREFSSRLITLADSVNSLLAMFPQPVEEDTEPESKFNFKDSI